MTDARVLRVALPVRLPRLFDYLAPASERGGDESSPRGDTPLPDPRTSPAPPAGRRQSVEPGVRVRVPFGSGHRIGVVLETSATSELPDSRLKAITEILDLRPVLDPVSLELLRWAADYYHHPIGEVLASALPKELRLGASADAREPRWRATDAGCEAAARGEPGRAPKQRQLLSCLIEHGAVAEGFLTAQLPGWRPAARALLGRGWIVLHDELVAPEAPTAGACVRAVGPALRQEQRAAVETVAAGLGRFGAFVLQGVTGSGKTEVYLRLVERVLEHGGSALVLVPEIGLTPQLVGRFRDRFQVPMAVLHSALTDRERLLAWRAAFSGQARLVLGTRSAVFAPLPALGLIVVDEEHDASFKQHDGGFRYSARDLAVVRAQRAGVPILLGSATPALETLHNITTGRYRQVSLRQRAGAAQPPHIALVDLRANAVRSGLSTPALLAIERHLGEAGQVLVFLNRRGYAPTLLCTACGWIAPCADCDARLTVHQATQRLRCHHCGADAELPSRCPQCGFMVKPVGQGTERIEEALIERFPGVAIARMDRDVVRRREDLEDVLRKMTTGEARILVGTQMVTKGHDFPNLTLVVVLNADQGLFSTDFRSPERLAQTLVQVAGRAGRGERPGEVLIQTELPTHPLLLSLLAEGYEGFARAALAERAQTAWPPFSRLAAVRDSAPTADAALEFLTDARQLARSTPSGVRVLGPVPAAMHKRAGRYHAQLLLECTQRTPLHHFLNAWVPQVTLLRSARKVRWALDVDPIELF